MVSPVTSPVSPRLPAGWNRSKMASLVVLRVKDGIRLGFRA